MPPSTPKTPTFVNEMVLPVKSAGGKVPARAASVVVPMAPASCTSDIVLTFATRGTNRPRSVATASPRWTADAPGSLRPRRRRWH